MAKALGNSCTLTSVFLSSVGEVRDNSLLFILIYKGFNQHKTPQTLSLTQNEFFRDSYASFRPVLIVYSHWKDKKKIWECGLAGSEVS